MILKHLGYSIPEMKMLTVQDFVILTDLVVDESSDTRDATQEDIDNFW